MLTLTDLMGVMDDGSSQDFIALLDQLKGADKEHPTVSATNADGVCLAVYPGERVTIESLDDDSIPPQHVDGLGRDEILALARLLDEGDSAAVSSAVSWQPGYGA